MWPPDAENPNFLAVLLHKVLQDKDFHKIRTSDTLFVDLDGTRLPSTARTEKKSTSFVNTSGTGIGVAVLAEFDLQDGFLVKHKSAEHNWRETMSNNFQNIEGVQDR